MIWLVISSKGSLIFVHVTKYEPAANLVFFTGYLVHRFARFSFLFDEEDGSVTSLFAKTEPTLKDYGDRLEFFSTLSNELRSQSHLDLGCVRIDYSEFNDRLLERCVFWHSLYGERLLLECAQTMAAFTDRISVNDDVFIRGACNRGSRPFSALK